MTPSFYQLCGPPPSKCASAKSFSQGSHFTLSLCESGMPTHLHNCLRHSRPSHQECPPLERYPAIRRRHLFTSGAGPRTMQMRIREIFIPRVPLYTFFMRFSGRLRACVGWDKVVVRAGTAISERGEITVTRQANLSSQLPQTLTSISPGFAPPERYPGIR